MNTTPAVVPAPLNITTAVAPAAANPTAIATENATADATVTVEAATVEAVSGATDLRKRPRNPIGEPISLELNPTPFRSVPSFGSDQKSISQHSGLKSNCNVSVTALNDSPFRVAIPKRAEKASEKKSVVTKRSVVSLRVAS